MTSQAHFQTSELTQPEGLNAVPWEGVDERSAFSTQLNLALWDTDPNSHAPANNISGLTRKVQPTRRFNDLTEG
jgi:hypothetical protein